MPTKISDGRKTYTVDKHHVRRYESYGELLDLALSKCELTQANRRSMDKRSTYDRNFFVENDLPTAVNKARLGWPEAPVVEVAAITEKIREDVRPLLHDTFTMEWDVTGGAVDVAAFLEGVPENMIRLEPVKVAKPGRVVTLIVQGSVSWRVQPEEYVKRGAAAVALVEALELAAISVEVFVEYTTGSLPRGTGPIDLMTILVKVKAAGERLDRERLLFMVANADSLRRIVFAAWEHEPAAIRQKFGFQQHSGYGYAPRVITQAEAVNASVVLEELHRTETADEWVRKHLVEFGLIEAVPA